MSAYDINSALGRKRGRYNQGLPTRSSGMRLHDDVCIAHWIVRRSGVLDLLESYRDEDFPNRRTKGGRPSRVTDEQLLVASLLAGMSTTGMHDKEMAAILWDQLAPSSRDTRSASTTRSTNSAARAATPEHCSWTATGTAPACHPN